jgi:hypothetical protein
LLLPGKKYTRQQIVAGVDQGEAERLKEVGYVLRHDVMDDTYSVVHWTHAGGQGFAPRQAFDPSAFSPPEPIKRRTPQERLDSLMLRFIEDCKETGSVPGLDDDRISFLVGEAWRSGRSEMTGEIVRQVARHFLEDAEKKKEASDYKRVVRQAASD